jgi:multidrug efflux system membrane fusion protein
MQRIRLISGAAVAAAVLLGFNARAQAPAGPPPVTVAKPVVKDITEYDEYIGRFEAIDQVDLRAQVAGYLDKVNFIDGALVKKGDLLFVIDQRPYKLALDDARAAQASARAELDFATTDFRRAETLKQGGNVTEQIFDQRRQRVSTARAAVDRTQAAFNRAQLDLEFTEIRAPIDGRVSRRLVSVGNLVKPNETVLTNIVSVAPIQFYFDVDERSYLAYSRLALEGQMKSNRDSPNDVRVATTDQRIPNQPGHMDFVDNRVDQASGTVRARAIFDNKDMLLVPGLFGRLLIAGSPTYRGVLVPEEAIGADQDRRVVYVVGQDNKVSLQPVRVGPHIDGYRVIRSGLTGDETIVVNGLMRVRPGAPVTPQMTTLPPTRERKN